MWKVQTTCDNDQCGTVQRQWQSTENFVDIISITVCGSIVHDVDRADTDVDCLG